MQFYSVGFLFVFLPLFVFVYTAAPKKARNGVLVLGSLIFYAIGACGQLWQLGLLVGLTAISYGVGRALARGRAWLLALTLLAMAGLLAFLKCYDGGKHLPPGLSFYLFQMAAYLIDINRQRISPETRLTNYAAQVMMFPKLMSGPLMPPGELQRQTWGRGYMNRDFHFGLQKLIIGLAMKVLLADRLASIWSQATIVGYQSISTPYAWLALISYALRLYFDFFGYSLMAMGLGQMLGFSLPENFHEPYAARSVSEFYRRWHITLGLWFREYLYIPLGGSRQGTWKTVRNTCIVWLFTGLWHGIGAPYLLWAGLICLLIVNEKLWLGKLLKKTHILCHIYTIFAILLSWLPFAVPDFGKLRVFFLRLFGSGGVTLNSSDYMVILRDYGLILLAGLLFATPLPRYLYRKMKNYRLLNVILFFLFWVTVFYLATAKQDPFLYFQF